MLWYVRQLVVNCVCLLLGAQQVVHSGFLEPFHWKQLPAAAGNDADEGGVSEPKQLWAIQPKQW